MTNLDTELQTYNENLPQLLEHEGKFVLIKGSKIVETFDTYENALTAGYDRFGLEPFFVRQIAKADKVAFISRLHLEPCPA